MHFNFPFGIFVLVNIPHFTSLHFHFTFYAFHSSVCCVFIFYWHSPFHNGHVSFNATNSSDHLLCTYSGFFSKSFPVLLFLLVFRTLLLFCVTSLFFVGYVFCCLIDFSFPLISNEKNYWVWLGFPHKCLCQLFLPLVIVHLGNSKNPHSTPLLEGRLWYPCSVLLCWPCHGILHPWP